MIGVKYHLCSATLDNTTRFVLVNAVHFKDVWSIPFSKGSTRQGKFFTSSDHFTEVGRMQIIDNDFKYKQEESFKIPELLYR